MTTFRQRLGNGELLRGTIVSLPAPQVVEVLGDAGFDWLFIDAEHAPLNDDQIQQLLQAAGDLPCLVRVPQLDEVAIKKVLDAGAAGIIIPQVNSAEAAALAVAYAKYPPLGGRGVGISRAHGYGFKFQEYIASANEEITVVVQAEHHQAVANIEAIARTAGIDAVFVGPYDLSASLGKMGDIEDSEVISAIATISAACQTAGTALGVFGTTPQAVVQYRQQGFSLLAVGTDTLFLGQQARSVLAELG